MWKENSQSVSNSQSKLSVTSLRKDCLGNLRFPSQKGKVKAPTHLLAFMSEFVEEERQPKIVEEADQFCCFDRIKKIIQKRNKQNIEGKMSNQAEQKQKIMKFVQIEAKVKKMEHNLTKYSRDLANSAYSGQNKNLSLYDASPSNIFLTSPPHQRWRDSVLTEKAGQKMGENCLTGKHEMQKKLRQQGYKHYLNWQKKKIVDNQNEIKQFVETEIQEKVKNMLEERDIKFNELLKLNKNLERQLLEKDLEIQNLKSRQQTISKRFKELQAFKDFFLEENATKSKDRQAQMEKFHSHFNEAFPGETIQSLKKYIQTLGNKCLQRFNEVECKNVEKWAQEREELNRKIRKLEGTIEKIKVSENELVKNLKQFRNQQITATLEIDSLVKKQGELEALQKKILSLYNEWYQKVPESSKQIMKNIGYLQGNYQYDKMLEHILVFEKKFSTDPKVNQYLIKILRGIQRIRKILFPRSISNSEDRKQILDPLFILEKLQKYMKSKVFQIQKKCNSSQKGQRASFIIEKQFLRDDQDLSADEGEKQEIAESKKTMPFTRTWKPKQAQKRIF